MLPPRLTTSPRIAAPPVDVILGGGSTFLPLAIVNDEPHGRRLLLVPFVAAVERREEGTSAGKIPLPEKGLDQGGELGFGVLYRFARRLGRRLLRPLPGGVRGGKTGLRNDGSAIQNGGRRRRSHVPIGSAFPSRSRRRGSTCARVQFPAPPPLVAAPTGAAPFCAAHLSLVYSEDSVHQRAIPGAARATLRRAQCSATQSLRARGMAPLAGTRGRSVAEGLPAHRRDAPRVERVGRLELPADDLARRSPATGGCPVEPPTCPPDRKCVEPQPAPNPEKVVD